MSKNTNNNKKMLKMQELQELQKQFEGIESENGKLTNVIGKIKQEINWYSTYLNKCKKENPTTFNRVINGTFDGSEGINMIDLELNNNGNSKKKISKKQLAKTNGISAISDGQSKKKSDYANVGLANGFDDIGIDLGFLETTATKQQNLDNDIIVDDFYFDAGILMNNNNNNNSNNKIEDAISMSNSNLNLAQLGVTTSNSNNSNNNNSILQQVQRYQYQEQGNSQLKQKLNTSSKPSTSNDEMMLMKSLKDALNNI
ncbi:hypothetical protein HANVADRAFT_366 [Hanseniaspora valbyensis NRRL Y-1626]|uniref:Uncharacterized protein n=1 Tax=Hanseniaspora valbyensis NRRL Y-1626 TaxID=766949 RepID=A0A1B7TIZ9_9ASCO|nr:hypothetical protein HANVADRAFT_366 [Hanseniaspora valbyensis NRRL Y-1626]